jgi:HlyD family secretion protein
MSNKRLLIFVVIAALAGGGVFYYRTLAANHPATPMTTRVTRGDVIAKVSATGALQPVTTVQVGTQVSGTIKALHADFNSQVHKGEVVAELEPALFEAQVEQARATLMKLEADAAKAQVDVQDAQTKLVRAQELSDQKLIARTDLETAQTAAADSQAAQRSAQAMVTQARAALNQVQVNLDNTIIKAPIDGVVISRNVDVGQTVAASMQAPTLFVIANDLSKMQVSASVDEADIGHIDVGQPVTFRVDAYPTRVFNGTVSQVRLQPTTEQNVVSYTTVIDVPNPEMKLKPGMTANVTIQTAASQNVLRVPNAALKFRPASADATTGGGQPGYVRPAATAGRNGGTRPIDSGDRSFGRVFVLRNGQVVPVRVQTGVTDGAMTAIVGGDLQDSDEVITAMSEPGSTSAQTSSPFLFGRRGGGAGNAGRAGGAAGGGAGR